MSISQMFKFHVSPLCPTSFFKAMTGLEFIFLNMESKQKPVTSQQGPKQTLVHSLYYFSSWLGYLHIVSQI